MRFQNFQQALDWLYDHAPMFGKVGQKAIKPGLDNIKLLCDVLGNPQNQYKTVHVAGTNGKGSSSHTLAAVLTQAGYKTGLYTSPHLKCFTERMRVDGIQAPKQFVLDFLNSYISDIEAIKPSFFEITTAIAFAYFAQNQIDVAIIETGLGGRLDSTNIICPIICLITHISYDHQDILGYELSQIAGEKAGIIKPNTPVVIGQSQPEIAEVFLQKAAQMHAPIVWADALWHIDAIDSQPTMPANDNLIMNANSIDKTIELPNLRFQLKGHYQYKNAGGILETLKQLKNMGYHILDEHIYQGFEKVADLTGLKGRWQIIGHNPLVIADVAHNSDAIAQAMQQLSGIHASPKIIVLGFSADKDIDQIFGLLPDKAYYIFCQANIPRAATSEMLLTKANKFGLKAEGITDINEALAKAKTLAAQTGVVYVGGSIFVVAQIMNL